MALGSRSPIQDGTWHATSCLPGHPDRSPLVSSRLLQPAQISQAHNKGVT